MRVRHTKQSIKWFLPIWLVCLPGLLHCGAEGVGTTSFPLLKLGSGARPAALGEAFVALADDASCLAYNPAGMSRLLHGEIQATHTEWLKGFRYENLGSFFSLNEGGMLGGSISALIAPAMSSAEQVAETADPSLNYILGGEFTPLDFAGTLSYSRPLAPGLLGGGSLKILAESLDRRTALGLACDAGVLYQTGLEGLSLGMAIQNLGLPASAGGQGFYPPLLLRAGSALRFLKDQGKLALEADLAADAAPVLALGAEWDFDAILQPRLGYRYNQGFNPWSAGLGVRLGTWGLDFAAVPAGDLGLAYRGTLYWRFGGPVAGLASGNPGLALATGLKEAVILPRATAPDKVASWGLYVYAAAAPKEKPRLVRVFSGRGALPSRLSWDGRDEGGQPRTDPTAPS
jgi:hypothetical protein